MNLQIVKSVYGTLFGITGALSLVLLTGTISDIIEKKFYYNRYREFDTRSLIKKQIIIPSLIGGLIGFLYGYTGKPFVENFSILIQKRGENKN
jgi:hypothetical protein